MKTPWTSLAIAVSLQALAADPSGRAVDWSRDRFLIGTWSCDLARPGRAPARERAVYSFGLGDRWLKLTYTLTPGAPDEPSVTTDAYETFDPKLNLWVYSSFGSDGDYGMAFSPGWIGRSKTYGPRPGSEDRWRLVQTETDPDHFVEVVETGSDGEGWQRASELRCQRSS